MQCHSLSAFYTDLASLKNKHAKRFEKLRKHNKQNNLKITTCFPEVSQSFNFQCKVALHSRSMQFSERVQFRQWHTDTVRDLVIYLATKQRFKPCSFVKKCIYILINLIPSVQQSSKTNYSPCTIRKAIRPDTPGKVIVDHRQVQF